MASYKDRRKSPCDARGVLFESTSSLSQLPKLSWSLHLVLALRNKPVVKGLSLFHLKQMLFLGNFFMI